jgi:hypothetical protein
MDLRQPDRNYVHPDYLYRPWAQLAEMLTRVTPGKLAVSDRTTGGTESVEGALDTLHTRNPRSNHRLRGMRGRPCFARTGLRAGPASLTLVSSGR